MASQKKSLSAKSYCTAALALACTAPVFAAALSIMTVLLYEPDVHYFKNDTPWFGVLVGVLIAVIAAITILSLLQKKDSLAPDHPFAGKAELSASLIAGVALAAFAISELRYVLFTDIYLPTGDLVPVASRLFAGRFNSVTSVSAILALVGAVYFILPLLCRSCKNGTRVALGCLLTVFFIFRLLVLYYDVSTPINSELKMFDQITVVAAMLYFVYELRFLLGEPKPRIYVPIAITAFIMLATHSTAQIVASIALSINEVSVFTMLMELALALYIFANLVGYLTVCKHYEPSPAPVETPAAEITEE